MKQDTPVITVHDLRTRPAGVNPAAHFKWDFADTQMNSVGHCEDCLGNQAFTLRRKSQDNPFEINER